LQRILVPIDFSSITNTVVEAAAHFAGKNGSTITLLHVKNIKSEPGIDAKLKQFVADAAGRFHISFDSKIRSGSIFNEISEESATGDYDLVMIGSHGFKGFREMMFGSDILKLLKAISIPVITILEGYQLPKAGFQKILLPVATHKSFRLIVDATVKIAQLFSAEIHFFSVDKPDVKKLDIL